ncbi:MAG TPA: hypothetical protein VHC50_08950 [Puia sp.]|nr:hypothetical protein [Puia sp.]
MKDRLFSLSVSLILVLGMPHPGNGQDLTGIWRGHFRSNEGFERLMGADDRYKIEVQIAQTRSIFQAVTYSYKSTEFYGKASASGTVNPQTKKVLLRELKILEVRMAGGDVCIMTCFLQYSKLGDDEFLQGTYTSASASDSLSGCGKGSIFLHKVTTTDFHKEEFLEKRKRNCWPKNKRKKHPREILSRITHRQKKRLRPIRNPCRDLLLKRENRRRQKPPPNPKSLLFRPYR